MKGDLFHSEFCLSWLKKELPKKKRAESQNPSKERNYLND